MSGCPSCGSLIYHGNGTRGRKIRKICSACGVCYSVEKTDKKGQNKNMAKVLVLDIETAPMLVQVWGSYKQRISPPQFRSDWFVLSWAAKWLCDNKIMSAVLRPSEAIVQVNTDGTIKHGNDERIVKKLWKLLDEADFVIAHNGKAFDLKKMNTRFLFWRMGRPMPYTVIDTLKEARKSFAVSSNKQEYLNRFLCLPQKLETDYSLWTRCISGDKKALDYMLKYNKQDVLGLEDLYFELRPWMKTSINFGLYVESNNPACPVCSSEKLSWGGFYATSTALYNAFRCECGAIGRSKKKTEKTVEVVLSAR